MSDGVDSLVPLCDPADILAWGEAAALAGVRGTTFALWRPDRLSVALGLSQKPERELNVQAVLRDEVPVFRRQSGGGAVLLMPGVLCWEALAEVDACPGGIRAAYGLLSRPVLAALRDMGIHAASAGISDVAVDVGGVVKKVAGTAQMRKKSAVLVHGSLLVDADIDLLPEYLAFPSSVPEYRAERRHEDFCTTVAAMAECPGSGLMSYVAGRIAYHAGELGWKRGDVGLDEAGKTLASNKYKNPDWNWLGKRLFPARDGKKEGS